jgi:hypothetical protein
LDEVSVATVEADVEAPAWDELVERVEGFSFRVAEERDVE